jgi:hypothetical protein
MDITPTDARRSLNAIDQAVATHRRAIDRQASHILLAWGVTYLVAPLCMHFWLQRGVIPLQLLLTVTIAYTIYCTSRKSPIAGPNVRRFGAVWGIVYGFGALWFFMLAPMSAIVPDSGYMVITRQMWAYGVTLAMVIYVVMGLWVGRFYSILGIVVTSATVVGLFWLGDWYWIWCSLTGGGTMTVAGLYLRRASRTQ